jgi:hypothetical protein
MTAEDDVYVSGQFVVLDELCARGTAGTSTAYAG